jgi:inosine-uridine nucleoside N-ribohydrolase
MTWMIPLGLFCLSAAQGAVPVILDTDIGDDIDDTWAICQMLGSPELDLKLVTVAAHNTPLKARLAAKILERAGRTDIPLGIGKQTKDSPINQEKWIDGYTLDQYKGTVHQDGVQALIDTINAAKEPVTLCAIGPLTNLGEALKRDPSIAKKARLVLMFGSVRIGYAGKATPDPEWNVVCDIPAAQAVFAAPWDITIAPLDTCGNLRLDGEDYARVVKSETKRARIVVENYELWKNRDQHPKDSSSILFDTEAVYLCWSTDLLTMETVKLRVDDKGMTVEDPKGRPVHCALGWKDEAAYKKALVEALTRP